MKIKILTLTSIVLLSNCFSAPYNKMCVGSQVDSVVIEVTTNEIKKSNTVNKLVLPFDFREYQLYSDSLQNAMRNTDDIYPIYRVESNEKLAKIAAVILKTENLSHVKYMLLDTHKANCQLYLIGLDCNGVIFEELISLDSNYNLIDHVNCYDTGLLNEYGDDTDWKIQSFTISKDLEIIIYRNDLDRHGNVLQMPKLGRYGNIVKQYQAGKYKISNEGKFVKTNK